MKKIVIYILLLATAILLPVKGTDVGKLHPVELVQVYRTEEEIVIATDTGAFGHGTTVQVAIENLEDTTTGVVFLDTAEYLLLAESAKETVTELQCYLKPSVYMCGYEGEIEPKKAAGFLATHKPAQRLGDYTGSGRQENLLIEEGQMVLKEI